MQIDVAWQPSLLDAGVEQVAPSMSFAGLRRITLDERSWIDHCPGWLAGSDSVFETLLAAGTWQQRTVTMWERRLPEPRLTAGWSTETVSPETPPILRRMSQLLALRYAIVLDRVWVNLYRDGRDSVAWHGDRNRLAMTRPLVATVSLGARRSFLLRRRGETRTRHRIEPGPGDLIVMGGHCQSEWEHTVPKTARHVGARMSVTIRHSEPAPGERWLEQTGSPRAL